MSKKFRIAVLASTNGTDLQAIIDQIKGRKMKGLELSLVISNKKNCYALERAKEQGFDTQFISTKNKTREEYDQAMIELLDEKKVDLVVLVGFMRILSPLFVRHFKHRIINVHPSLLPKYGGAGFHGMNVHEAVLENGDAVTGMTIHFVDEGCDTGPIIHQAEVEVEEGDTPQMLKGKVQVLEKRWYPEVIRWIQNGKIVIGDDDDL
jgi:phosphoribosylglycinamide formyltransferase 1